LAVLDASQSSILWRNDLFLGVFSTKLVASIESSGFAREFPSFETMLSISKSVNPEFFMKTSG
jgi:hypothetical protein